MSEEGNILMLSYELRNEGAPEDLNALADALLPISDEQLEEKLVLDGLHMGDERFGVFHNEYRRRNLLMPQ